MSGQRKTQHLFACSGTGEPSAWTWEAFQCYPGSYCAAAYVSLPCLRQKGIGRPTSQLPQPSRKIPSVHHSSLVAPAPRDCRKWVVAWDTIYASEPCSHPSSLLTVLWFLPPPSTSCTHLKACFSMSWEILRPPCL